VKQTVKTKSQPLSASPMPPSPSRSMPTALAEVVRLLVRSSDEWMGRVQWREGERWYERLVCGADYDVWLISWLPGQGTGLHDHGQSTGAFAVANGVLEEWRPGAGASKIEAGQVRGFGKHYLHDVRNAGTVPAVSVHAYSPPLSVMNRYEVVGNDVQSLGRLYEGDIQ
jgi:hypothetical protein